MKLKVACDYSPKFKKGDIVEVDAMEFNLTMATVSFRVIGVWKEPRWFNGGYFCDFRNRHIALVED